MNEIFGRAFSTGLLVAMGALVAYQVFMLWWTKKTLGKVPGPIKLLRSMNIALLSGAAILIAVKLLRG